MIVNKKEPKKKNSTALLQKSTFALNRTIEAGVTLSAPQRKALNALHYALQSYVKQNFDSIELFNAKYESRVMDFKIKRQQFESLIAYMSRNRVYLKDVLRQLSKIQADWHNDLQGDKESYRFTNIFMEAGLETGYVHVKIPPQTRQALVNENVEATIDIIKLSQSLFGKYSISLYEVVQSYFEKVEEDVFAFEIEDEILRNSLNVPYTWDRGGHKSFSYPGIGKLNEKVLKPSIAEINESDFEFKVEHTYERLGCGTIMWTFEVTRTSYSQHRIIANEFASEMADLTKSFKKLGIKRPLELLTKIGSEKDVLYYQYCVAQVEKAIRSRKGGKEIKGTGGYLMKVIENNVEAFEGEYKELLEKRHREQSRARANELMRIDEQIEGETKKQKRRLREANWNTLNEEQQQEVLANFREHAKEIMPIRYIKLFDTEGPEGSPALRGQWFQFLDDYFDITDDVVAESIENMVITSTFR